MEPRLGQVPRPSPQRRPRAGPPAIEVDVEALRRDLENSVRGEVRFDAGERAAYATDASNYREVPLGVVRPRDAEDVEALVAACRRHGAPITPRGTATSLAGQTCNVAVIVDFTAHLNRFTIDPGARVARVQPGALLDHVRQAARRHGLTVGPDPATHRWCTIGGMIGNNSCGAHAQMAGRMEWNVHELEILTWRGDRFRVGKTPDEAFDRLVASGAPAGRYLSQLRRLRDRYGDLVRSRYPNIPRRISGYNLEALLPEHEFHVARALVGTEGTCALMLEADVRLVDEPGARALVVLGYPDVFEAADHVPEVLEAGPIALEGIDDVLLALIREEHLDDEDLGLFPSGRGFLIVELGGEDRREAADKARALAVRLARTRRPPTVRVYDTPEQEQRIWEIRELGLAATARVPGMPDTWPGWEDSAVAPERVGTYLRDLRALLDRYGYHCSLYGHFGQGCVHCSIDFELGTVEGVRKTRSFLQEAADLVVSHGGSLSGEHGDGQARAELLDRMFGPELVRAFEEFKGIWDPDGRMNPGKVVHPRRLDQDLRLGPSYHPRHPPTRFAYPDDQGSLPRAAERCVGVGKCRREEGGTMCPSYKVLREERHTTRGRAHLLSEMLRDDSPVRDGFRSDDVAEALDLCLSCKGCKGDCPMKVDVATLKAEFLARRYEGRLRPRAAYALGLVREWSRVASLAPRLVNLAARTPLATIGRWIADVHPDRPIPVFARETFRAQARRRPARNLGSARVLLWVDTWTEHFRPEVGLAAMDALEAAGFEVLLLRRSLCCGRPLYDFGMLDRARTLLEEVLAATRRCVEDGVPIVVLEPSCHAVFVDELRSFFPDRDEARRLRESVFTLGRFLEERAPRFAPHLERTVVLHGHCHQKALVGIGAEQRILERMGCRVEAPDTGCCGMAGTFGYETRKHDLSVRIAEQQLLPHLRGAEPDALVVSDGFSCRTQIADLASKRGLHLAEVLKLAIDEGREPPAERRPRRSGAVVALVTGVVLAVLALALRPKRGR